ncbi:MAG: NTP transferase domain-containing protein [Anaerolineae bacterium]
MTQESRQPKAVILVAGDGGRLRGDRGLPKALLQVLGRTLLERTLETLVELGVCRFVVVTGYGDDRVRRFIRTSGLDRRYILEIVHNGRWREGTARSVWTAREAAGDRFLVVMGDHLFDPNALAGFLRVDGDFVGAFDSRATYVDLAEATKAQGLDGKIERIGKDLETFEYVDAGLFLCSEEILPAIERCLSRDEDSWNDVKREWIQTRDLHIYDLRGGFWLDIDTPQDLERARHLLRQISAGAILGAPGIGAPVPGA